MRLSESQSAWWIYMLLLAGSLAIGCGWAYNCYCAPVVEALTGALG